MQKKIAQTNIDQGKFSLNRPIKPDGDVRITTFVNAEKDLVDFPPFHYRINTPPSESAASTDTLDYSTIILLQVVLTGFFSTTPVENPHDDFGVSRWRLPCQNTTILTIS